MSKETKTNTVVAIVGMTLGILLMYLCQVLGIPVTM